MPEHKVQVVVGKAVVVFGFTVGCLRIFRGVLEAWTCGLVFVGGEGQSSEGRRLYFRVRGYRGFEYFIALESNGLLQMVNFYGLLMKLLFHLSVSLLEIGKLIHQIDLFLNMLLLGLLVSFLFIL